MIEIIRKTPEYVEAKLRSWEGPLCAGDQGRHVWHGPFRFPIDQGTVERLSQRHARAEGATVAQSVSYWGKLAKHLTWTIKP